MAVPTFTYGLEIRTFTKKQEARIETVEMNCLRSVAGYKRRGQKRNSKIMEELNIFNLNDKILNFRSQWRNHVLRMEDGKNPKKILAYNPRGRRDIGRPQLRWTSILFKRMEWAKYGLILEADDDDIVLTSFEMHKMIMCFDQGSH
jgi:hypothetical protein